MAHFFHLQPCAYSALKSVANNDKTEDFFTASVAHPMAVGSVMVKDLITAV